MTQCKDAGNDQDTVQGKIDALRDKKGRFTREGMKGNKHSKKDFTREMAEHVTSQEMYWCARMITQLPYRDLVEMVKNGEIDDQSLLTHTTIKKAVAGDFKPMQFMIEMICGKAKQQIEQRITEHTIQINIDADDNKL